MTHRLIDLWNKLYPNKPYSFNCLTELAMAQCDPGSDGEAFRRRLRGYLVGLAKVQEFPSGGDATLNLYKMMRVPAWHGRRWQNAVNIMESPQRTQGLTLDLVRPDWTPELLLNQSHYYYLCDVAMVLGFDPYALKSVAQIRPNSQDTMGVCRDGDEWIVEMAIFSKWYRNQKAR